MFKQRYLTLTPEMEEWSFIKELQDKVVLPNKTLLPKFLLEVVVYTIPRQYQIAVAQRYKCCEVVEVITFIIPILCTLHADYWVRRSTCYSPRDGSMAAYLKRGYLEDLYTTLVCEEGYFTPPNLLIHTNNK